MQVRIIWAIHFHSTCLNACHWISQTLVAVSEVGGQPARRLVDSFGRPLPVWQMQRLEATILLGGICKHWYLGRKRLVMTIIKEGGFVVDWYRQRRKFVVLNDDFTPVLLCDESKFRHALLPRISPTYSCISRNRLQEQPCNKLACHVAAN